MAKPAILMKREGSRLVPLDSWALEQLSEIPEGVEMNIRATKAKKHHGKLALWWAGLGVLVENFDDEDRERWPTARKAHNMLLEALGFTEKLWRIDGTYRIQVDSIALDAMDEKDFTDLMELAAALTVRLWGYDPWQAWIDQRSPR